MCLMCLTSAGGENVSAIGHIRYVIAPIIRRNKITGTGVPETLTAIEILVTRETAEFEIGFCCQKTPSCRAGDFLARCPTFVQDAFTASNTSGTMESQAAQEALVRSPIRVCSVTVLQDIESLVGHADAMALRELAPGCDFCSAKVKGPCRAVVAWSHEPQDSACQCAELKDLHLVSPGVEFFVPTMSNVLRSWCADILVIGTVAATYGTVITSLAQSAPFVGVLQDVVTFPSLDRAVKMIVVDGAPQTKNIFFFERQQSPVSRAFWGANGAVAVDLTSLHAVDLRDVALQLLPVVCGAYVRDPDFPQAHVPLTISAADSCGGKKPVVFVDAPDGCITMKRNGDPSCLQIAVSRYRELYKGLLWTHVG